MKIILEVTTRVEVLVVIVLNRSISISRFDN